MSQNLFKDKDICVNDELIKNEIGNLYFLYKDIIQTIEKTPYNFKFTWKYYNDINEWFLKVYFKKVVFWLSFEKNFLKISFFFNEENEKPLFCMGINEKIIQDYNNTKPHGKIKPLFIWLEDEKYLKDFYKIIDYKISIK